MGFINIPPGQLNTEKEQMREAVFRPPYQDPPKVQVKFGQIIEVKGSNILLIGIECLMFILINLHNRLQ